MAIKILILEDDTNLGNSLKDFFTHQKGADVHLASDVEMAEYYMMWDMYDLLIVDLVMPQVNGLDFLKRIISKNYLLDCCKVWCISGVLDNSILSASLNKHVSRFFKKPLDIQQISQIFSDDFDLEKYKKYFRFFYMEKDFNLSCSNVLNQCKSISNHHLVFLYLYLFVKKFNGTLDITGSGKNGTDKLYFENGKICALRSSKLDRESYLGNLLVKNQMISSQDVKEAMEKKGDQLLGDYLVNQCLVSPHVISNELKRQIIIRLNQTIDCPQVNISFSDMEIKTQSDDSIFVHLDDLMPSLEDWIFSKVSLKWIRNFFKNRSDMILQPSNNKAINYKKGQSNMFELVAVNPIKNKINVYELIDQPVFQSDKYIYELYYRLLIKDIYLSVKDPNTIDEYSFRRTAYMKAKLTNFIKESTSKSFFELLGVSKNSTKEQLSLKYRIAMSIFHPDYRSKNISLDLHKLYDKIFSIVNQAHSVLSDREKRQSYLLKFMSKEKEKELDIETKYKQSLEFLKLEQYEEAFRGLEEVLQHKGNSHAGVIYWIWSTLKKGSSSISKVQTNKLLLMLDKLPENLKKADFFFVQGMLRRRSGDKKSAKVFFEKALSLNPHLVPAKQEMYSMNLENSAETNKKKKKSFWGNWRKSSA